MAAAVCGTYAAWTWGDLGRLPVRPLGVSGGWVQTAEEGNLSGCFRREFYVPGHVRNAWLAVAACDGFEVTVNEAPVGWQYVWRPSYPFQYGLSERGQSLNWPKTALSLNFAREYQLESHRNYRLPIFLDLTPSLTTGKNVICVDVESRRPPAKMWLDGEIELFSGQRIALASGPDWRGEVIPPDHQHPDWRSPDYDMLAWHPVVPTQTPPGELLRTFDPRIYTTAFRGWWIRHPSANAQQSVWFETQWRCDQLPDEAWMRIAANRSCEVFINGRRGFVATPDVTGIEGGEWIFNNWADAHSPSTPEELESAFVARTFFPP